jgi:serine/threonine protein kinase
MSGMCRCRQTRCKQTGMSCISAKQEYCHAFEFDFRGARYRVHRFINSGAHAHAFLAHEVLGGDAHGELGRTVCAKFFHKVNDKELVRLDDIRSHKYYNIEPNAHVVEVLGFSNHPLAHGPPPSGNDAGPARVRDGSVPGQYGFVLMEMGHLGEVLDYIYEGNRVAPFSERFTRRFFKQLLVGLKYMHDQGVWHRDLKPENLLFDAFGNIQICDFGLAKTVVPLLDRVQMNPMQTSMMATRKQGSPSYMSPEMVAGKPYNERTDVWSCGCTLLVISCGKLPPTSFSHRACDFRVVEEFMGPGFSDDLMAMMRTIFVKNHRDRASLEDLLDCNWLRNDGDLATDAELAELFVSRNPNRVKRGIDWAPKHSQNLGKVKRRGGSGQTGQSGQNGEGKSPDLKDSSSASVAVRPSVFYATLVGKYVNAVKSDCGDDLLRHLGLQRFASSVDCASIDELEMLMEAPEGMTPEEYAYLGKALVASGKSFEWAVEVAAGEA